MKRISRQTGHTFFINARFLSQPLTGVQRYSRELLRELDTMIEPSQAAALCPAQLSDQPNYQNIDLQIGPHMDGNLWEQIFLLWKTRGNLLFSPANTGPYLKKNQVLTIHDMSVFAYPMAYTQTFQSKYRLIFRRLARTAAHILTVSEFSKKEIQKYLGIPAEKITVTYEGREHIERAEEDFSILEKLNIGDRPYFLVVGSLSRHKNLEIILSANADMDQKKYQIVTAGSVNSRIFKPVEAQGSNNLVNAGYVSDDELKALYNGASSLIFPSLYEGFGLPLVEAMACGCPIICSNIPSSHEICESAALYFDPYSACDLTGKMEMILEQSDLIKGKKKSGLDRAKHFSWKKTANMTKDILLEI